MQLKPLVIICVCAAALSAFALTISVAGVPTDVEPSVLQQGMNDLADISDKWNQGHILVVERYNADVPGRGYKIYQVMLSEKRTSRFFPNGRWAVVGVENETGGVDDYIRDERGAENASVTVRFARGRVAGKQASLLFISRRKPSTDNKPTEVTVEVYKFVALEPLDMATTSRWITQEYYKRLLVAKASHTYCNTDMALNREWGFSLPADYQGSRKPSGCWRITGTYERSISDAAAVTSFDPNWGTVFAGDKAHELLAQCSRDFPQAVSGTWTPSVGDITALERDLAPLLSQKLKDAKKFGARAPIFVGDFYRQYGGILIHGRRLIYVNGFHRGIFFNIDLDERGKFAPHDWTDEAVHICDGGAAFFGVLYDPTTHKFTDFSFNGVA